MNNTTLLLTFFIITPFFFGCDSFLDNDEAQEKIEYVNLTVAPNTLLVVSSIGSENGELEDYLSIVEKGKEYSLPLGWIQGFEYEKGYEYKIKVKKITPVHEIQDAPRSFYYLIEILSKNKVE